MAERRWRVRNLSAHSFLWLRAHAKSWLMAPQPAMPHLTWSKGIFFNFPKYFFSTCGHRSVLPENARDRPPTSVSFFTLRPVIQTSSCVYVHRETRTRRGDSDAFQHARSIPSYGDKGGVAPIGNFIHAHKSSFALSYANSVTRRRNHKVFLHVKKNLDNSRDLHSWARDEKPFDNGQFSDCPLKSWPK